MATTFSTISSINNLKIAQIANALYGTVLGSTTNAAVLSDIATIATLKGSYIGAFEDTMNYYYSQIFTNISAETVANGVVANLGVPAEFAVQISGIIQGQLQGAVGGEGKIIADWTKAWAALGNDTTKPFGDAIYTAAAAWNATIVSAQAYTASGATANTATTAAGATTYTLTTSMDNFAGTVGNDTYLARTANNGNTLQDGDSIDGNTGTDTVWADFVPQTTAITPNLQNIETVAVRAQNVGADTNNAVTSSNLDVAYNTDAGGSNVGNGLSNAGGTTSVGNNMYLNTVLIDAQRSLATDASNTVTAALGVTRWESNNSRNDVVIEDVRIGSSQKTGNITVAMVETDAGNVDFGVYFDQLSLRNATSSISTVNIELLDTRSQAAGTGPLKDNPYNGFAFYLNGEAVIVQNDAIDTALTYADLLTAINNQLTTLKGTNAALSGMSASLGSSFSRFDTVSGASVSGTAITLTDTNGGVVTTHPTIGWVTATGTVPPSSGLHTNIVVGTPTGNGELVTVKVVLDDVGRGSTGGDLVVGGMSTGDTSTSRGVERFEIAVGDNSRLQTINSTNNALREVFITSGTTSNTVTNAYRTTTTNEGDLTVNGSLSVADKQLAGVENGSAVGNHAGNSAAGFTDVRLIDASGFKGKLAFTAAVTTDSIAKYVTTVDTATSAGADVANTVTSTTNTNFDVMGANYIYTGGNDDDTMNVSLDNSVTASQSNLNSGRADFTFDFNGGEGNDAITVRVVENTVKGNAQNWAMNQDLNNNITINAGAGNDTIRTPGAGDTKIDAGAGNDLIFTDNTGDQGVVIAAGSLESGSGKGVFAFNTLDQVTTTLGAVAFDARNISNLRSDTIETYNLYKATLYVTFKGLQSTTITLANATTYTTTDFEINQAIKNAINNDTTLKTLLVARDGPAGTLVVESLIDGALTTADLAVTLAVPAAASLSASETLAAATAWGMTTPSSVTSAQLVTQMTDGSILGGTSIAKSLGGAGGYTANGDYSTAMATNASSAALLSGAASTSTSDNFVTPGSGNDIIVLGTTAGTTVAASSNEVVTFAAGFGNDVIVNFDATAAVTRDHLNLSAFLGTTAVTLNGAINNTNSAVTVVVEAAANDTVAEIKALYDALAQPASATKQVYIAYSTVAASATDATNNVAKVYSVTNGTAATDVVVTLEGTIDLAATGWATLTVDNFTVPTTTAEGASTAVTTLATTAAGQTLTGSALGDTFTVTHAGAILVGNGGNDTFNIATGGAATINDLNTGDAFTVAAGTTLTNALAVTAFVATSATTNAGTATLTAAAAGATIDMSLAGGTVGYTITGAAGADTLTGSAFADTISGSTGINVINAKAGADTITIANAGVSDTVVFDGAFAAGIASVDTITGFLFNGGALATDDKIDIGFNVSNGTTVATAALVAIAPVATASNTTATANDVIFYLNGVGDVMVASTAATAVANAVTALTSGTDFSSANIATGDSLVLQMNDGTNTYVFHYVADATPATTAAADLELIGIFNAVTATAVTGNFI